MRYLASFVLGALGVGMVFFVHWMNSISLREAEPHTTIGMIDWSLISAFSVFAAISLWGMIGVGLSNLKKWTGDVAIQDALISRKSWHYRLNTWINAGEEPLGVGSECEYWARLFHGFLGIPPLLLLFSIVIVFFSTLIVLIGIAGWFLSARTYFTFPTLGKGRESKDIFDSGHQWIGPIVFVLVIVGGLYFSGAGQVLLDAPWMAIGKWSGGVIGALFLGTLLAIFFIKFVWPGTKSLSSYAGARMAGVCRPVQFVD